MLNQPACVRDFAKHAFSRALRALAGVRAPVSVRLRPTLTGALAGPRSSEGPAPNWRLPDSGRREDCSRDAGIAKRDWGSMPIRWLYPREICEIGL